jgi:4,5-DOPA dioxygenase extradiol
LPTGWARPWPGTTARPSSTTAAAPHGAGAHPTEEHLLPLFAALGAAEPGEKPLRLTPEYTYSGLAMDAYLWQDASPAPFTPEPAQQ